ncbi:hypothetical protein C27AD_12241 [Salinisphaera hydrothermalis C27AD]
MNALPDETSILIQPRPFVARVAPIHVGTDAALQISMHIEIFSTLEEAAAISVERREVAQTYLVSAGLF